MTLLKPSTKRKNRHWSKEEIAEMRRPRPCRQCFGVFVPKLTARKGWYCSIPCRQKGISISTTKQRSEKMRGTGNGISYIKFYGKHIHRRIAETLLGRTLSRKEVVHHINHNHRDNRPENLMVVSRADHARLHFGFCKDSEIGGIRLVTL